MNAGNSNSRPKVLLIEDNPGDARLMREYLAHPAGAAFELEHRTTLNSGLECIAQGGVDLVLLDLSLPDSPMPETFKRTQAAAPHLPIIVMSGLDDEGFAVQTVQEGAQDYLVKSYVDTRLLLHAMRYAIERKRAEEALAQERDLFHTLLDSLPDRIFFKDDQSRFTRISRALTEHFNLAHPRDAAGKSDHDFFMPEHADSALKDEKAIISTGQPVLGKVERETLPDGSISWALTSKLPLRNRHGQTTGIVGISRDITALKKFEEQLESERNLLRSLIDNLPDYIYVKDSDGRYLLDNIAHRRFLGVDSEKEVVGKTVSDFFSSELAEKFARDDTNVIESGHPLLNREEPVIDRVGNKRWHSTTKVPIRNSESKVTGLVAISRDITESKLAEQALQEANTELARHKDELQKTLSELQRSHEDLKSAQFQLIQAEKMQSIGRLAAGVAHEVKNPLGILRMGVDYLRKNFKPADENEGLILDDMADAIQRADSIIHGLLDFSAPHALDCHHGNINVVAEQSLSLMRHAMNEGNVKLVRELGEGLPAVWFDKNKIKQVFVNLLTNAVHAMPEGGTLTVRTRFEQLRSSPLERDEGSRQAELRRNGDGLVIAEILDTGSGIPDNKLAQIFDPFFTTKETGKGTGLGLSVTKKIMELHGGTLEIRNRKEGGVLVELLFRV